MEQSLATIVQESGLEKTQSQKLLEGFKGYFEEAKGWEEKAMALVVTDASEVEKMKQARESRLALKKIRCDAENTRKTLKENSVREGKAIDGMANIIKALIMPIENHLEFQEKFVERLEEQKKETRFAQRKEELSKYVEDVSAYDLKEMSQAGFDELLQNSKGAKERLAAEAKLVEQKRVAAQKAEAERVAKVEAENARLKKEAEKREAEAQKERLIQQKEREAQAKIQAEKDKAAAEEKAKLEAKLKVEAEAKAKLEADKREADRLEKERLAKIEEDKKSAAQAPDKEKLLAYAQLLGSVIPPVIEDEDLKLKLGEAMKLVNEAQLVLRGLK